MKYKFILCVIFVSVALNVFQEFRRIHINKHYDISPKVPKKSYPKPSFESLWSKIKIGTYDAHLSKTVNKHYEPSYFTHSSNIVVYYNLQNNKQCHVVISGNNRIVEKSGFYREKTAIYYSPPILGKVSEVF